jgi:predicted RNase H-like nuclease
MTLVGVDGCSGGWLCVVQRESSVSAFVAPAIEELLRRLEPAVIAVDVPIGLTDFGPRLCDLAARQKLGRPRASSVFPAPVRATLTAITYQEACEKHQRADGRRLTRQTFGILPKIREADCLLSQDAALQRIVREIHPELSFAQWNAGRPMAHRKSSLGGRAERELLIETRWSGLRRRLADQLRGSDYQADDLNDALAALWTAERICSGHAVLLPREPARDRLGLRMEIWA